MEGIRTKYEIKQKITIFGSDKTINQTDYTRLGDNRLCIYPDRCNNKQCSDRKFERYQLFKDFNFTENHLHLELLDSLSFVYSKRNTATSDKDIWIPTGLN